MYTGYIISSYFNNFLSLVYCAILFKDNSFCICVKVKLNLLRVDQFRQLLNGSTISNEVVTRILTEDIIEYLLLWSCGLL